MGLFDCVENIASGIVHGAEDLVGGAVNTVEGLAGGAVNLAGGVLNSAEGLLCPLLGNALGPLSGLLGGVLGGQSSPLPFSGISSVLNNPAQFATNLSSASDSLGSGLGQVNTDNIDSLENTANQLEDDASKPGATQGQQLKAQQALMNLQLAVEQASTKMNILGEMAKKAIDNARLQ